MTIETAAGLAEVERFLERTADERLADYLAFLRIPASPR